jgi:hypothetical protein
MGEQIEDCDTKKLQIKLKAIREMSVEGRIAGKT